MLHMIRHGAMAQPRGGIEVKGHDRERQIRLLLQRLERHGGWLARERLSCGDAWRLHAPVENGARTLDVIAEPLVQMLKRRDLITPENENDALRWRISARGRRWLRRCAPGLVRDTIDARGLPTGGDDAASEPREKAPRPPRKRRERLLIRDGESGALREVAVNVRENPLMWLARRKDGNGRPYLEAHHVAAGERLRRDYEIAAMQPTITASWNPALTAGDRRRLKAGARDPFPFTERVLAARQRVRAALETVGDELADIVVSICCLGDGIEAAERALQWPRRSARVVLRIALERLAAHYRLRPARERATVRRWQRALSWHAEDGLPAELLPPENDRERHAKRERG